MEIVDVMVYPTSYRVPKELQVSLCLGGVLASPSVTERSRSGAALPIGMLVSDGRQTTLYKTPVSRYLTIY